MNETLIYLTGLIAFFTYTTGIMIRFGVQKSISESYYRLNNAGRLLFGIFIILVALPPAMIIQSNLMYLGSVMLLLVAVAEDTKANETTKIVHLIGAISGIVIMQIAIAIYLHTIVGLILTLAVAGLMMFTKNRIWWVEVMAGFVSGYIQLWFVING